MAHFNSFESERELQSFIAWTRSVGLKDATYYTQLGQVVAAYPLRTRTDLRNLEMFGPLRYFVERHLAARLGAVVLENETAAIDYVAVWDPSKTLTRKQSLSRIRSVVSGATSCLGSTGTAPALRDHCKVGTVEAVIEAGLASAAEAGISTENAYRTFNGRRYFDSVPLQ